MTVRAPRFFCPDALHGDRAVLTDEEARHALAARRLAIGDAVELFDGRGTARMGEIERCDRRRLTVRFVEAEQNEPVEHHLLTIALSPPRGDRMAFAVEKLSELGCHTIMPVVFQRSLDAGVTAGTGKIRKWRRRLIESAKQCGRNRLAEITEPLPLAEALEQFSGADLLLFLDCHEETTRLNDLLRRNACHASRTVILVGPEGGLTAEERCVMIDRQGRPARLWNHVLRIETAALAAAALYNGHNDSTGCNGEGRDPR